MELVQVVRTARRRLGCSQRALADQLGVSSSAVARWETAAGAPTAAQLRQLLLLAGLELHVELATEPERDAALVRHLRLSLTQRLRLALGDAPAVAARPHSAAWRELLALARVATVELEPPLADALWIPTGPVSRVRVTLSDVTAKTGDLPPVTAVEFVHRAAVADASLVPVPLQWRSRVWVRPPIELVAFDDRARRLREAARLLHSYRTRDDGGRRTPAHRDPDEWVEQGRLLRTRGADPWVVDARDGRAWRLGSAASLAQRLRER